MNFQSDYVQPPYGLHNSDTDMLRELIETIREVNYSYNDNMRYHNRILESYNQNMNLILMMLHSLYTHVLQRNRTQDFTGENRHRGFRGTRNTHWTNFFTRRTSEPTLETDLSSLILYLFTNGNPLVNPVRNTAVVPLTSVQIEQSTEMIAYNTEMGERSCPISMENFEENEQICRIRGCRHIFKREHLMRWLHTSINCPVCRYDLRDFSNNTVNIDVTNISDLLRSREVDSRLAPDRPFSSREARIPQQENVPIPLVVPDLSSVELEQDGMRSLYTHHSRTGHIYDNSLRLNPLEELATSLLNPINLTNNSIFTDIETQNISQLLTNLLRNQFPTVDASNNLLYTLEIPLDN